MPLTREQEIEMLELEKEKLLLEEESSSFDDVPSGPEISQTESAIRGGIQGLPAIGTWADEIEGGVRSVFSDKSYKEERDAARQRYKDAEEANTGTYNSAMMAPTLALAPLKAIPVLGTAASGVLGAVEGAGASEADDISSLVRDTVLSGGLSAATAGIGNKIGMKLARKTNSAGEGAKKWAEKAAENATGATGLTVYNKFDEGAGRHLLDHRTSDGKRLLSAGDTPETLAAKIKADSDLAGAEIDEVMEEMRQAGVTISPESIIKFMKQKASSLKADPSQAATSRQLLGLADDVADSQPVMTRQLPSTFKNEADPLTGGMRQIEVPGEMERLAMRRYTPGEAEQIKRGYSKTSTNWANPDQQAPAKEAYGIFKDAVENEVENFSPQAYQKFKDAKRRYGMQAPMEEAASKRAAQLQQMPWGGLLDTASVIGGANMDGTEGAGLGIAAALARRKIMPRVSSTAAVGLDKLGDMLKNNAHAFGKYSMVLQQAASRGDHSLGAANFVLQQTDDGYRQLMQQMSGDDEDSEQ